MIYKNFIKLYFKNKSNLVFILILLLAAFVRFYRLAYTARFDADAEFAANFAYSVVKEFPIQLIGQGLSVQGLFMGPIFFYIMTPFFVITNLHPIGAFAGFAIISLIIVCLYYFVGKSLFGERAGLISAFIRAVLFSKIHDDLSLSAAWASEIPILVTWWCFYKYWNGETKYFPILGLMFGLYTSIHPILFPFYFVFLILLMIKRKLPSFKTLMLSIVVFLVPVSPLILFEFFHNFLEVKRLILLFSGSSSESINFYKFLTHFNIISSEPQNILGLLFIPKYIFLVLFSLILLFLISKKIDFWKNNFHKYGLLITFLTFLIYYLFYPAHVTEYYYLALGSLTLLYLSGILSLLTKNSVFKILLILIILNITFINFRQFKDRWFNLGLITLYHKDYIVKEILKRQPKDQEFYVSYISQLGWNFGFDYLFKLYGHQPQTKEVKQPVYTIVLPKSLSPDSIDISSGNIGLILPE